MPLTSYKQPVTKDFPPVKLSYDKLTHKKVYDADIIFAIPYGKKCLVWFTQTDNKRTCYVGEVNRDGQVTTTYLYPACFNKDLSYGSIFYGTFFTYNQTPFVAFEDIIMYKGKKVQSVSFQEKLDLFNQIFKNDLPPSSPGRHFVSFGLPLFHNNHEELLKLLPKNQSLMCFQYKYFHSRKSFIIKPRDVFNPSNEKPINTTENNSNRVKNVNLIPTKLPNKSIPILEKIFTVSPDIQNDIYHLHDSNNKHIGVAYIPDYVTSVMLNKLFRNIKENINLDALEESDDEEEFECEDIDKFVNLDKKYNMICEFNRKFKMWVPRRVCE